MSDLSASEIEDVREVFDLFDFWDGRDGLVDAHKIGELLRSLGLNPTNKLVIANGGTTKLDVREVFDLFDFWDGRDGMVDGAKVGEFLRCCGLNPTNKLVECNGGTQKLGDTQYKFEEILPIYKAVSQETDNGTFADFMEGFKTFDRDGQGFVGLAEIRNCLAMMGDKQYTFEEILPIYKIVSAETDCGTLADFMEGFKTFDREGQGSMSSAELRNVITMMGDKQYKFEEILPIYKTINGETDTGTFADFAEGFKTFDREGQGFISAAELRNVMTMMGDKQYTFEEILPIFKAISAETDCGTFADFMEGFKTFDREGQGYMSAAELRNVITMMGKKLYKFEEILPIYKIVSQQQDGTYLEYKESFKTFDREGLGYISSAELRHALSRMGERMSDEEVDSILKFTDTCEDLDGNIKYEDFIKKVMAGPSC